MMERKDVILKLAQIRTERNISQYELSLRLDKTHTYIHEVEKGKNSISLEMFLRICKELDVDPATVFS